MNMTRLLTYRKRTGKTASLLRRSAAVVLLLAANSYIEKALACEPPTAYISPPTNINIDPTIPVGTVLGTTTLTSDTSSFGPSNCDWGSASLSKNIMEFANGVGTPNGKLYPTSIDGVSYRVQISGTSTWPFKGEYAPASGYGIFTSWGASGTFAPITVTLELVKTGPMLAGGTFAAQPILVVSKYYDGITNSGPLIPFYRVVMNGSVTIQPVVSACTITNSNILVELDGVNHTALQNAGSTAGDKVFNIPLNCTYSTNISLYFSGDMADSSNAVFKNNNAANSAGVGIQLLDATSTPVSTSVGNYVNVGSVKGDLDYPVTARYYALGNGERVGDVNAIAYASIVYN